MGLVAYASTGSPLAPGTEVDLLNFSVPAGRTLYLQGMTATGEGLGRFRLFINNIPKLGYRTSYQDRNALVMLPSDELVGTGIAVEIRVTPYGPTPMNFEGTLFGAVI